MKLSKQETALISFIRILCFEDLLDATHGIYEIEKKATNKANELMVKGDLRCVDGFNERASNLNKLADLLGEANADYRFHINPEEGTTENSPTESSVIQMIESDAGEIVHLFEVMKKYGVMCSLQMNVTGTLEPIVGMTSTPVDVEYFEGGEEGDSVIVTLGDTQFSFDLKNHSFSKYVTNVQIEICIAGKEHVAWFNSDVVPPQGIEEANNYSELFGEKFIDIDMRGENIAESLEKLAAHIRNGWTIGMVSDCIEHDGYLHFELVQERSEGKA